MPKFYLSVLPLHVLRFFQEGKTFHMYQRQERTLIGMADWHCRAKVSKVLLRTKEKSSLDECLTCDVELTRAKR